MKFILQEKKFLDEDSKNEIDFENLQELKK